MSRTADPAQLKRFVAAYLGDAAGNQADAARAAGYKGDRKSLSTQGARLLKRPDVKALVAEHEARAVAAGERGRAMTEDELRAWWTDTIRGELRKVPIGNVVVKLPPSMPERLRASELLAKSLGMFGEKKQSGPVTEVHVYLPDNGRERTVEGRADVVVMPAQP